MEIIKEVLEVRGSKVLGNGITTDKEINYYGWGNLDKPLKFIVAKGFIDDWCIYVEAMDKDMSFKEVENVGNKIHNREIIKKLVDCSEEVLKRYRD